MIKLLRFEKGYLFRGLSAMLVNVGLNLTAPAVLGYAIDHDVVAGNFPGVLHWGALLLAIYLTAAFFNYFQTLSMGNVGQRLLYRIRQQLFEKLQQLPLSFFQSHQAGDLISRLNNDTSRVNDFFSSALVRLASSLIMMLGAGIFMVALNPRLGGAALVPALALLVVTAVFSPWIRARNAASLKSTGDLSAEISESLDHFKVLVAFQRRDYFRRRFDEANRENYRQTLLAGLANGIFSPVYAMCSQLAQLVVLAYGLWLVERGECSVGLLIGFFIYIQRFYDPLRQLASLWSNLQGAMAGWDRISAILDETANLPQLPSESARTDAPRLEFRKVGFSYQEGRPILHSVDLRLEPGKTYALVGPTGGGKTTIASLMARLYDANTGQLLLDGCDLRSCSPEERSRKIGFILQEPFLFDGTLADNGMTEAAMGTLLGRFPLGLDTPIAGLSLGQRQIVAFVRAVERQPELLILDEATANIDTVTEQALGEILERLPASTTRVIIAHRLNTIENADQIYFVNAGRVELAGSLDHALDMLRERRRDS